MSKWVVRYVQGAEEKVDNVTADAIRIERNGALVFEVLGEMRCIFANGVWSTVELELEK